MTKALTKIEDNSTLDCYLDTAKFEHNLRVAGVLAKANLVPKHYSNSVPDCFIALNQAALMNIDPMLFMQKTYVIGGKIGLETQLALALTKKAGVFVDVIQYRFSGKEKADNWTCTAFATTQAGTLCEETCSVQDAKDMGWWTKNAQLWQKHTKKALRYRSAMNLIRLYCPEVLFGLDSKEELMDWQATQKPAPTKDITQEAQELQPDQDDILPDMKEEKQPEPIESIEQLKEWKSSEQFKADCQRLELSDEMIKNALADNTGNKAQSILDLIRQSQ